jgi:hypothetical protein
LASITCYVILIKTDLVDARSAKLVWFRNLHQSIKMRQMIIIHHFTSFMVAMTRWFIHIATNVSGVMHVSGDATLSGGTGFISSFHWSSRCPSYWWFVICILVCISFVYESLIYSMPISWLSSITDHTFIGHNYKYHGGCLLRSRHCLPKTQPRFFRVALFAKFECCVGVTLSVFSNLYLIEYPIGTYILEVLY